MSLREKWGQIVSTSVGRFQREREREMEDFHGGFPGCVGLVDPKCASFVFSFSR